MTEANHQLVVSTPKAKSQRQILLAPATVASLRQHRAVQLRERLALGEAWTDSGYMFVDEAGRSYHPHSYLPMFRRACASAGAPKIRLHDLRHTMATLALEAGVHPKVVPEQVGHSGSTSPWTSTPTFRRLSAATVPRRSPPCSALWILQRRITPIVLP